MFEPSGSRGRRRLRTLFIAGGALIALVAGAAVLLNLLKSESHPESVDTPATGPTATSTMGVPAHDGPIEFLVESIELIDASSEVTPSAWKQLVKVRVTNTGTAPQSVSPVDQRMIDAAESEYHPDPVALGRFNESGVAPILLQPGETATMSLPFSNGPDDPRPAMVVLHAGPNAPGVAVKLSTQHAGSGSAPGP